MKHWTAPALLTLCLFMHGPLFTQISENLKNLEGSWYEETRNSITYASWENSGDQTLENRTFSIICGDTVLLSSALIQYTEDAATLTVSSNGTSQRYRLIQFDNKALTWENEAPNGFPRSLKWLFSSGGYASLLSDGVETVYRRETRTPLYIKLRAALGANLNQYTHPAGSTRLLANKRAASVVAETQILPGVEAAFTTGVLFPSTPIRLNFELGVVYRQVGIQTSFYDIYTAESVERNGRYRNYNYFFGILPEVYVGRKRNLSFSAGFYVDIFQRRYFKGISTRINGDRSLLSSSPDNDIDYERGLMFGFHYRLASQEHLRPQIYLRYTHGLNNTQVRAISLGVAVEFEKQ